MCYAFELEGRYWGSCLNKIFFFLNKPLHFIYDFSVKSRSVRKFAGDTKVSGYYSYIEG